MWSKLPLTQYPICKKHQGQMFLSKIQNFICLKQRSHPDLAQLQINPVAGVLLWIPGGQEKLTIHSLYTELY